MRVCPKCGFVEPMHWRPTTWKSAQYIDCCRLSDLEYNEPEFAERLKKEGELIEGHYAYRITKPGVWVYRRWIEIFKVQGWKEIPAEKYKPPDLFQQKLVHVYPTEK